MRNHSATDMQAPPPVQAQSMAQRLHAALMPDYNGKATAYWWLMLTVGTTCFAAALLSVAQLPL